MPITDDVRKYGETVLEQGKIALDEARKPWYAAVGAGELAYGQLQAQLAQVPAEVQARVRTLQANGRQLDPAMLREAVDNARAEGLRYTTHAKETYESLAHRGELVVRRLRRSSQVSDTFKTAEELVAEAGQTVAAAEEKVTKPGRMTTRKPAAPKAAKTVPTTARKAPATPRKAPTTAARKAPAKRTPKTS